MFIVKYLNDEIIQEDSNNNWHSIKNGIESVSLVHPVLNISIGLHGYDRYAFICEGVMLQHGLNIPRIAEILWGELSGLYVCIRLFRDGTISSMVTQESPQIVDTIWKYKKEG